MIIIPSICTINLQIGDMVQLRNTFVSSVASLTRNDSDFEIVLERDIPPEWIGQTSLVEFKDTANINEVKSLATRALKATTHPSIKAESFYIFGRLYHMLRDYDIAFQLYEEALKNQPDMPLAAFGLGQLFMSKQEYGAALEKFHSVRGF
jgi:tetratricopeptide (TPR) repeat protein